MERGSSRVESKTYLALFLFCAAIFAHPLESRAAPGEHSAGVGVGQILLMGDYAKHVNDSIGYTLMYGYDASALFGLLVNLSWNSHTNVTETNSLDIKSISPALKINLAFIDKLAIYAKTGFGVYTVDEKLGTVSASGTSLGFTLGGGFDLRLDKHFQFGTSLAFTNIFGKTDPASVTDSNPAGINIGGTYLSLFLNAQYIF